MLERHHTRAKILATLGPASQSVSKIRDLLRSGVDGFRINMSHGTEAQRTLLVERVHQVRDEMQRPVAVLMDLRGPRLRLGNLPEPIRMRRGETVVLMASKFATEDAIPVDYDDFAEDVKIGHHVLLRDGQAQLLVQQIVGQKVRCKVSRGATVSSNQGVNLPDSKVSAPILSRKDKTDLDFAARFGMDWVALSFVRNAGDIEILRGELEKRSLDCFVMAKIEHPEAVKNIEEILDAADAVMVARGDLAVEMGHEVVPTIQKRIIRLCLERAVPVVTATQMLESMLEKAQPTRAEVSDVANAVLDGSDAVMLSGETAVGEYPLQAVRIMHRILVSTEAEVFKGQRRFQLARGRSPKPGPVSVELATVNAAATAAVQSRARMILAFTESGRSVRLVSSFRGGHHLIGLTSNTRSFHRMALFWGVHPALMPRVVSVDEMYRMAAKTLSEVSWLKPTDLVVALTGTFAASGATNTVRLLQLSDLAGVA